DERRQQRRAGLRCEQALVGREDQGAVRLDRLGGEAAHRLEALLAHRDLDDDVGGELRERPTLLEHALDVLGDDLGGDGPWRDLADLLEDRVVARAADLRVEGWVRRDAVEDAPAGDGPDLVDVGGVEEDLHRFGLLVGLAARLPARAGGARTRVRVWRVSPPDRGPSSAPR